MTMKSSEIQSLIRGVAESITYYEIEVRISRNYIKYVYSQKFYDNDHPRVEELKILYADNAKKEISKHKKKLKRLRQLQVSLKKELKYAYLVENVLDRI